MNKYNILFIEPQIEADYLKKYLRYIKNKYTKETKELKEKRENKENQKRITNKVLKNKYKIEKEDRKETKKEKKKQEKKYKIKKEYTKKGEDPIIIIGDWDIPIQMKHFISTPNKGLKRKLIEKFKMYEMN